MRNKPTQQHLVPRNEFEAMALENSPYYGRDENKMLDQLRIESAARDLAILTGQESQWPLKEVKTPSKVQFQMGQEEKMRVEEVYRLTYKRMSSSEAADHLEALVIKLREQAQAEAESGKPGDIQELPGNFLRNI